MSLLVQGLTAGQQVQRGLGDRGRPPPLSPFSRGCVLTAGDARRGVPPVTERLRAQRGAASLLFPRRSVSLFASEVFAAHARTGSCSVLGSGGRCGGEDTAHGVAGGRAWLRGGRSPLLRPACCWGHSLPCTAVTAWAELTRGPPPSRRVCALGGVEARRQETSSREAWS